MTQTWLDRARESAATLEEAARLVGAAGTEGLLPVLRTLCEERLILRQIVAKTGTDTPEAALEYVTRVVGVTPAAVQAYPEWLPAEAREQLPRDAVVLPDGASIPGQHYWCWYDPANPSSSFVTRTYYCESPSKNYKAGQLDIDGDGRRLLVYTLPQSQPR